MSNPNPINQYGDGNHPLHEAAELGDVQQVALLLNQGADPNSHGIFGEEPLHVAARRGNTDVVTALLDQGANPNAGDGGEGTPQHQAAWSGEAAVVSLLLERGAKIEPHMYLDTPLHYAARSGDTATTTVLLEHGADIRARNNRLETPLHAALNPNPCAAGKDVWQIVALLLLRGADAALKDIDGLTALDIAEANGHEDAVRVIKALGNGQPTSVPVKQVALLETGNQPESRTKTVPERRLSRVAMYIDGYNFYLALKKDHPELPIGLGWCNFRKLFNNHLKQVFSQPCGLVDIKYFTSPLTPKVTKPNQEAGRQKLWLEAVETIEGLEIIRGKWGGMTPQDRVEKQTDINIATEMVLDALKPVETGYDILVLVSNDTDLIPAIHAVTTRVACPKQVYAWTPLSIPAWDFRDMQSRCTTMSCGQLNATMLADSRLDDIIKRSDGSVIKNRKEWMIEGPQRPERRAAKYTPDNEIMYVGRSVDDRKLRLQEQVDRGYQLPDALQDFEDSLLPNAEQCEVIKFIARSDEFTEYLRSKPVNFRPASIECTRIEIKYMSYKINVAEVMEVRKQLSKVEQP